MSNRPKARILLIDDVEDWRRIVGGLLQYHEYQVVTASSMEEAIQRIISDEQYDLAIVDLHLDNEDEEDGVEFAFWARNNGYNLPIIILTAFNMKTETAQKITRRPYNFTMVKKDDIGSGDYNDLFYQIELAIPWSQRPVRAFVIMPFQESFDGVYSEICNTLKTLGIDCLRVDKDYQAGYIPNKIRKHLRHNSFVIADLTGQNPNVLYELGYAHALGRPTILLCQDYNDLPQDLSAFHAVGYNVKFTGIETLKRDLVNAVTATLSTPSTFPQPRRGLQIARYTHAQFIPDTSIGQVAKSEIVAPVVKELKLREQSTQTLFSSTLRIEENWSKIQTASVIIAEISEGNPSVYYHVGASDAMRDKCVLLLNHQGITPPFNLKGRANIVTYDPSNFETAKAGQQELKNRIRTCLKAYEQPTGETIGNALDAVGSLGPRKAELRKFLEQLHNQVLDKIDEYVQHKWSADERLHRAEDIRQMKQYVGQKTESLLNAMEKAKTSKALDKLNQQLSDVEQQWYYDALKQIMR